MNSDNLKSNILKTIEIQNPWHRSQNLEDFLKNSNAHRIKRENLLARAYDSLNPEFALILQGPRRVGKSELMLSLIASLIEKGREKEKIEARQICYIDCDNPLLHTTDFFEYIKWYFESLFEKEFYAIKDPLYIFIDEIFTVPEWERVLKSSIDLKKQHYFIVTGSASLKFITTSKQSLAGRMVTLPVTPFSFFETIDLRFLINPFEKATYDSICSVKGKMEKTFHMREIFENQSRLKAIYQWLLEIDSKIKPETKKNLDKFYKLYLLYGGYPGFIKHGQEYPNYFSDSILEPVIYKDLSQIYGLNSASRFKMERMIYFLLFRNTGLFTLNQLQELVGEKHHVRISDLLHTLQTSLLFDLITPLTDTPQLSRKNKRKVYFLDTGLVHQVTGKLAAIDLEDDLSLKEPYLKMKGYAAETALHQHLKRLEPHWNVCYLRNEKNDRDYEIDFVWKTPFGDLPIECKMRNKGNLGTQIQNFKAMMTPKMTRGFIITTNDLRLEDNILCCPHYYFLGAEHV